MKQLEQARKFLAKAAEDETLLDAVQAKLEVSDSIYGFHAQQAAEKLLKALLSVHAVRFPKTHDLHELLNLLENAGETLWQTVSALERSNSALPGRLRFEFGFVKL